MTAVSSVLPLVFCPPPLGKPDASLARPLEGPDTRSRIIQLGSKDNTCWYSVFNLIRFRFRAPNAAAFAERKFELIASGRRKEVSQHERSLPDLADQLNNSTIKSFFSTCTKEVVQTSAFLALLRTIEESPTITVKTESILPEFLAQNTSANIYDYLIFLKFRKRVEINEGFFTRLGIDPETLFNEVSLRDPFAISVLAGGKQWKDLSVREKNNFLDQQAKLFSAERYGLKVSAWHPKHPIGSLIEELKAQGPLAVGGCFGRLFYACEATDMGKEIEGRKVYGWKRSDPKVTGLITAHMILIVGAEKTDKGEYVYYIDPLDDSDPANAQKQHIYVMSYSRLTSPDNICDNYGLLRADAPEAVGYAFCHPK